MILDLIVILLVIVLSYLLCMDSKNHNCQLSHIVIGLTIIVFYKLVRYYNNKNSKHSKHSKHSNNIKEGFNTKNINDFLKPENIEVLGENEASALTDPQFQEYLSSLNNLVDLLKEIKNNAETEDNSLTKSSDVETINLENQQAYQQYQINYLNRQIKNAQDIINNERIVEESKNYKPIKVYSSCSLNTDGSLTAEEPVKNEFKSINPLEPNVNSYEGKQMIKTIQQGNTNKQENIFTKLLQQL
jgi:hypothetical protein